MSEVHAQARTTPKTRAEIRESPATLVELAERYNISKATARKWKSRDSPEDLSHRPHKLNTTLTPAQEAIVLRKSYHRNIWQNVLSHEQPKIMSLLRVLTVFMLFIQATVHAQQDITLKTDPIFQYYYNVMSEERFASPQAVLDAYQNYENARIPDQVTTLSNLRPNPSSTYFLNGLPIIFVWDYFFHYPKYPPNDYGSSTGTIDGEAICPWAPPIEGLGEWRAQYENLGHLDGKVWCEITFKHPALPPQACNTCPCPAQTGLQVGNPILPATGQKLQRETDYSESGPGALAVSRTFITPRVGQPHPVQAEFSDNWFFDQAPKIKFHNKFATTVFVHGLAGTIFFKNYPEDPHSQWVSFSSADKLRKDNGMWSYFLAAEDATYTFNEQGDAVKKTERNGRVTAYAYVDHRLTEIANAFQRKISIAYDSDGRIQTVTQPDGGVIAYAYDDHGRLASVQFPDSTRRQYRYDDGAHPTYLTDVVDEAGMAFAHFAYDSAGRAISTEHAGGAGRYALDYGNFPYYPTIRVTDALTHERRLDYATRLGRTSVVGSDGVSDGGAPDKRNRRLGDSGLVEGDEDYYGVPTDYVWTSKQQLSQITRASNRPEAQTTTTQWHPDFNLPVLVTEAGRTTAYTYDPLGNRLTETVTDTTTGEARTRRWTYDATGLVATATEPNGAVTSFVYDSAGNPTQSTDPLGRVTTYAHDAAGRLTQQTDPTGTVSAYTYDLRGRLLTHSRGGLLTSSTYTPTGLVSRIAYPNGYVANYTYDPAHRLTGWSDNRGAAGRFTLDGMGNRTAEQTLDAQGAVAWQVARSINQINRVASETQGLDQTVNYTYDANGERIAETDALGQTTQYGLDGLRRIQQITDSLNAQATLAYDPRDNLVAASDFKGVSTAYTRDAHGGATQERSADIGTLATTYDALGLPQKIVDALGRTTAITRDPLGRPTALQYTDGSASVLRYDLAGADFAEADAPGAGIGTLGELQDPGVTTRWRRDALGRVTRKQQVLAGGATRSMGYGYVTATGTTGSTPTGGAGQIARITYPSGGVLGYAYDATGQLSGLSWNNTPLVNNLTWNPLGQPTGWQWPFVSTSGAAGGLAASRRYNTAGQLVQYELGSYTWDAAGRVASLTQALMLPTASGLAPTTFTTAFTYDGAGRILGMAHAPRTVDTLPSEVPLSAVVGPQQIGIAYDANGNRQSVVYTQGEADSGLTLQRTYSVAPDSNRLTGYAQTLSLGKGDPTVTQVPFTYDATGSITQAGQDVWGYGADGRLRSVERASSSTSSNTSSTDTPARATYLHNALGQRVVKTNGLRTPAVRTETVYADGPFEGSTVLGQYRGPADGSTSTNSTGTTEFIYLPTTSGPMPIAAVIDGRLYAVHSDHLNTPRRLTRDDGQVAWQWVTTAFGEVPPSTAETDFVQDAAVASSGGAATSSSSAAIPFAFDLRYPGQVVDEESGLFYNYFRSYCATCGRYIQNDPIGLAGAWNRVLYAGGNPLIFTDPLGLLTLPNNPSGLPPEWTPDPSHRDPNGERFRDPNGGVLDWHKGRPGLPGWRGKDHWHHNGGDEHLPPGTEVPDSCPPASSLFDRLKNALTPPPVYDPRQDRLVSMPPIFPRVIPLPIP